MSEKLSNLLDTNVSQSELDEFLSDCKNDPQQIDVWQRYHAAKDLICNEISEADLRFDVADKVIAKIKSLPSQIAKSDPKIVPFAKTSSALNKKPWISTAIAASMLLGLYFIVQQTSREISSENLAVESLLVNSMPHWQASSDAIEDELNSLLVEHSEFTSVTGMNGLGSYSKFVSYQKL